MSHRIRIAAYSVGLFCVWGVNVGDIHSRIRRLSLEDTGYDGTFPKVDGDLGYARRQWAVDNIPISSSIRDCQAVAHPEGPFRDAVHVLDKLDSHRQWIGYQADSGNRLSMLVDSVLVDRAAVPLMTSYERYTACADCRGSSGGCPGFAPEFDRFAPGSDTVLIMAFHLDMRWAKRYAAQYKHLTVFNQMSYADMITETYLKRVMRSLGCAEGHRWLGAGNCAGCQSSKCTIIRGKPCIHPEHRTFSCEATGVDCDAIHCMLYGERLPWYYGGTKMAQSYMTRYAMLMATGAAPACCDSYHSFLFEAMRTDKTYIPYEEVPGLDLDDPVPLVVPRGVNVGYVQYVRDPMR